MLCALSSFHTAANASPSASQPARVRARSYTCTLVALVTAIIMAPLTKSRRRRTLGSWLSAVSNADMLGQRSSGAGLRPRLIARIHGLGTFWATLGHGGGPAALALPRL